MSPVRPAARELSSCEACPAPPQSGLTKALRSRCSVVASGDYCPRVVERRSPRVLVVCQDESLSDRFRREFDGPPAFALEFVSPAEYARRVALGTADTDMIVLDASAVAPSGFDVHRVLQPRMAAPPVVVLRARPPGGERDTSGRWRTGHGVEALEMRLLAAMGRRCERFTWMPVRYEGRHLQACLPGTAVTVDGRPLELSRRESELLGLLLAEANRVVLREVLIAEIWGYETRSLDVYIRRLRRKLGVAGAQIETITGIGYRFAEPAIRKPPSAPPTDTSEQSHRLVTDS